MRAITQEIHFPATIVKNGEGIVTTASLTIDRTKWGITYQSGSVFGLAKDKLLEDSLPVSLVLRFHQQHFIQYYFATSANVYTVTLTTEFDKFNFYKQDGIKMLDSFLPIR